MRMRLLAFALSIIVISAFVGCEYCDDGVESPNAPQFMIDELQKGHVSDLSGCRADVAVDRWCLAIEGANHAQRKIPILDSMSGPLTALIVIDMQCVFVDANAAIEVPAGREIIPNINAIADCVRKNGGRVYWMRYLVDDSVGLLQLFERKSYLSGNRESPLEAMKSTHPQFQLCAGLDVQPNDVVMDKTRYSAVLGSAIVDTLRQHKIENVIITGVTTDVCAGNTAEDLMQMGFHIVMVWDGCAALDRLEHELYLARIFGLYGDVMPTKEVIARLHAGASHSPAQDSGRSSDL